MMLSGSAIFVLAIVSLTVNAGVYFTPCSQSSGRSCPSSTNRTDFLLSMKKGGTNILSTNTYLYDFFLCEEYNYDCGYLPAAQSYVTVANGVGLNINATELADITTLTTTQDKIKPYLGKSGETAKCGMSLFPLQLTTAESKQVLDGYMSILNTKVQTFYNLDRNASSTLAWSAININIRTAVLQKFKANSTMIRNSTMWTKLVANQFTQISTQLKEYYSTYDQQIDLHASYLIDSVTQKCNKLQSVNFVVDQSGSIGAPGFQLALDFLEMYVNDTNDDLSIMSIHFYDNNYDEYITYGHDKAYFMSKIPAKPYRAMGTLTGKGINETVNRIVAKGFKNGIPKIMVVMTDGVSYDSISQAAKYARDNEIIPIAVGIGPNVDTNQLLQIAGTASNYIQISSYADLPKLVDFISNYFCKQIITISLNESYEGNFVRVPESPSYFRVIKSPVTQGQFYELDIAFQSDPIASNHSVVESQIDPFPDQFTEYTDSQYYEIYNQSSLSKGLRSDGAVQLGAPFVPRKIYFIQPEHQVSYVVKKQIDRDMNVTVSYVSIKGVNLGFNISLKVCTTLKCDVERAYYQSILNKKTKDFVIVVPPEEDLSIFIVIGSTLAVMASLCVIFIFACRKFNKEEQKKSKGEKLHLNETIPTDQNIEQTLVPEPLDGHLDTGQGNCGANIMPTQTDSRLNNKNAQPDRKSNKRSRKSSGLNDKNSDNQSSKSPKSQKRKSSHSGQKRAKSPKNNKGHK